MVVAIYARFSSSSQREASIEEQVKICREYAERNKHAIIKVYSDSAISGKTDDRPQLQKLLADSSRMMFQAVLVYSIDRFGRDLTQTLLNEKKLNDNGVVLLSVTENFTDDASGRFFRNLMMAHAQYYSDELSAKIRRGMDYNAERCLYNGGGVPLGYKIGQDKRFEIDPDTAPVVQYIFQMYANGKTVKEITDSLNAQGLRSSKGAAFNKNSLHTILQNRRYLGFYIHMNREVPGGIPRIISDELFEKVAGIMEKNRKAPARARAKVSYLLTTKLFCGHCKEMMTGSSATGKLGKVYNYYSCNGRKNKTCKKKLVNKDYIENLVVLECRRLLTDDNIKTIAREIVAISDAEKDNSNLKRLKRLLSENERRHKNAINAIMESDIESVRKSLGAQIPILEKEHEEIERQIAIEEEPFLTVTEDQIRFFLSDLKKGDINDIKYRKTLIDVFVNRIYLYDDKVTITYNSGSDPVTISDQLLSELEEQAELEKNLYLDASGPPKERQFSIESCRSFYSYLFIFPSSLFSWKIVVQRKDKREERRV